MVPHEQPRPRSSPRQTGHGPTTHPAPGWRLTADEEATAIAELKQAAAGRAAPLADCAGLALGYGEHQSDAVRYRQITDRYIAVGMD